jgi:hypothetical protein
MLLFYLIYNAKNVCAPGSALSASAKKSASIGQRIGFVFQMISYIIIFGCFLFIQSPFIEKTLKKWMIIVAMICIFYVFLEVGSTTTSESTYDSLLLIFHLILLGYGFYFVYYVIKL